MYSKINRKELEEFQMTEKEIKEIQSRIDKLKQEEYNVDKKLGLFKRLFRRNHRENIGKCFEKIKDGEFVSYCRVTDNDVNQYRAICFKYPYDSSKIPFYEESLLFETRNTSYVEITREEFSKKLSEVHLVWIKKIINYRRLKSCLQLKSIIIN